MTLFSDYLQPLTVWIYANPHWALFFTFLISFTESLAIIGSIIPGSVTMTAIGILAGSGVMRIDLTLFAAILGAVAGDSASYLLGSKFKHRLPNMWPFSRYPNWLRYGREYFAKHGGKSVLIGRFIGPLRSVIPLIAGMMHMNRWHFLLANVASAIGWSIVYVMPGVLIGAASSELSAENASRLFILILVFLVFTWLLSVGIKWILVRIHFFLKDKLHRFWITLSQKPKIGIYIRQLTPDDEENHSRTVILLIIFLLCLFFSIALTALVTQSEWISLINKPIQYFFHSLQTQHFDAFFILISLFIHPLSLSALVLSITIYTIYHRDLRTLTYWLSLTVLTAMVVYALNHFIHVPQAAIITKHKIKQVYPSTNITFATALFGFLILYISTQYRTVITLTIRITLVSILFIAGIGAIYLADNWISGVLGAYSIGFAICLGHWILYRRKHYQIARSHLPIVFSCLALLFGTAVSYGIYFNHMLQEHRPYHKQYVLTKHAWWNQTNIILPIYTTNRIGQKTGLFNIQFAGNIRSLEEQLSQAGWKKQTTSFFFSLLEKASGLSNNEEIPLMAQLYQNLKPALVMTYKLNENHPILILRLWRSNFHLKNYSSPIWLGSIHQHLEKRETQSVIDGAQLFTWITQPLSQFKFKMIHLNNVDSKQLPLSVTPVILLVIEPQD
ncbi:VTT domain-containing protein [Legionella yabuuchiae]|uniref:VTT domain-containing protein n=1 Tax=Legionella yabuuchiae TaxID=376727 RepID=UPI0010566A64|nr:VTT domain-containing protein [Legionella yabuuchiae]